VEVFGSGVVGAVDYGGDGETGGDAVFDSGGVLTAAGSCYFRHGLVLCSVYMRTEWMERRKGLDDNF